MFGAGDTVAGDGVDVALGVLSHRLQRAFLCTCGGDEDRCYPGFGSCFYEWCSLANWNIGKQNGIRASGAELFIKFIETAGKRNIAVDEHAQGRIGKLLTNAAD